MVFSPRCRYSMMQTVCIAPRKLIACFALAVLSLISHNALASPASGYWWNPAEGGRGFVIEIQGTTMFMAGFLYDASGRASWVASSGPMTSITQYSGPLITYQNGQTLTGPFKPSSPVSPALGTLSINFSSDTQGSLTWPGGTVPIQRYDFGPGGSQAPQATTNPQPGWWWNTSEGGRGFAIEVQGGTMYLAGYMYDASGNTIWYLASGPLASPGLFQGQWEQFANGQTLTGAYKPSTVLNPNVAYVTLQIIDPTSAVLTLPNEQIPLSRYNFGLVSPVLSSFSPSAAAPNSLLNITGSGIDPTAALTLTVFDNTGYSVSLPLAAATTSSLELSVPVYVSISTSMFSSGTVNLKLTQSKNGASADSNSLTGFNIEPLPTVPGTPGTSTLSLIRANLSEAQRLQTAVSGTAQDTPAVNAALAQQVTNLQALVINVRNVVEQGESFTLGIVGGVNIAVTPANIGQVDSFILATLQSLVSPGTGTTKKRGQVSGSGCLGAEAAALAAAITSGGANLDQLMKNLLEAPFSSAACNTAGAFTSAYQIFGGAGNTGIGITNQAGATGGGQSVGGVALFATATANADTAIGINALLAPALAGQINAVQNGIGSVSALAKPVTDQLLASSSGDFTSNVGVAQTLILTVAPPPSTGGPQAVSGNYIGSAYPTSAVCNGIGDNGNNSVGLAATITTQGNTLSGAIHGTDGSSTSIPITGTYNAGSGTWSVSISGLTDDGDSIVASGTIAGNALSGTLTDTKSAQAQDCAGFVTDGVFALTRQ
jgi:hypothetical protein